MIYRKKQLKELRVRVTEIMNSMEKWYFSPRTLTKVKETLTYVIVTKI